jgi:hypothetical protein
MERCAPLTICTMRPAELLRRCAAVEIPLRVLSPQLEAPDPLEVLPDCAPPFLIDAVGMCPLTLAAMLVALTQTPASSDRGDLCPPVGVLLDPVARACRQVVALAPEVRLLIGEALPFEHLLPWARHLPAIRPVRGVIALGVAPLRPLPLPALFLRLLAVLPHATSMVDVAERCATSRPTLHRALASTRTVLGLPAGRERRFVPTALAEACVQALGRMPLDSVPTTTPALVVG